MSVLNAPHLLIAKALRIATWMPRQLRLWMAPFFAEEFGNRFQNWITQFLFNTKLLDLFADFVRCRPPQDHAAMHVQRNDTPMHT